MDDATTSRSSAIRAEAGHPVIDSDGHFLESRALFRAYLGDMYGGSMVDRYDTDLRANPLKLRGNERSATIEQVEGGDPVRDAQPWGHSADARELATCVTPRLLHERMPELGFDFSVLYPTFGLPQPTIQDPEVRQATLRALNTMNMEMFRPYADRLTPAAMISMHTPTEAIELLTHAVDELGFKVVCIPPCVARPMPGLPLEAFPYASLVDRYGIDSAFDYDPVWRAFADHKVAVTSHGGSSLRYMPTGRRSPSNYSFNHIGAHAFVQAELCRSLVMGGVVARFPDLAFAFLECGVGWACDLLGGIAEHWEKRNLDAMVANLDPGKLDLAAFSSYIARYGAETFARIGVDGVEPPSAGFVGSEPTDEWGPSGITDEHDVAEMFRRFWFGCEADDHGVVRAADADRNPFGTSLQTLFSSDIGHWDAPRLAEVLEDSHGFVEKGLLSAEQWRRFVFDHPVALWTRMDTSFFDGTCVEAEVRAHLGTSVGSGSSRA